MKHDFPISVAVQAVTPAHDQTYLHALPRVKWIFDPSFHYTPSYATDVRKTFERIRQQMESRDRDAARFRKVKVLPLRQDLSNATE